MTKQRSPSLALAVPTGQKSTRAGTEGCPPPGFAAILLRIRTVKNVVPFKAPHTFDRFGIDWTKDPKSERERALREAFLTYETSCGINGLASILLLATVSRRQGAVADDLQHAADFAEIMLAMQLGKHQAEALTTIEAHLAGGGALWS